MDTPINESIMETGFKIGMKLEEKHEAIAAINEELFGPATSFVDLPRDEKQKAYELAQDGLYYGRQLKLERRVVRSKVRAIPKWALRHSQIRAAAKKRGKPWQWRAWVDAWGMLGLAIWWGEVPYSLEAKTVA